MLHHVPGIDHQDAVLAEMRRVLRPGGLLAGEDSLDSPGLRDLHRDDTYVPVDPDHFATRLEAAGFVAIEVTTNDYAVRFHATKPRTVERQRPGAQLSRVISTETSRRLPASPE